MTRVIADAERPLDHLADPAVRENIGEPKEFRGVRYQLHAYMYQEHRIWGATAQMLLRFINIIKK